MKMTRKSMGSWLRRLVQKAVPLLLPLSGLVVPAAANAQAAQGSVQTVIIIDFQNKSGTGAALAKFATDAVAVELANSGRFEVLKRNEVTRQAKQLGMVPPYDNIALTKLAQALAANDIITGEIAFADIYTKKGPKTARVGLLVKMRSGASSDLINGAAAVGTATAPPGGTDDLTLLQEAVSNAAYEAVRSMLAYNLPEGTVLNTVGSPPNITILINRGSRDGVKEGMEMIVLRNNIKVGTIRVTTVYPTDSEPSVVNYTMGISPEDHVRAIFMMPTFTANEEVAGPKPAQRKGAIFSNIGKIVLALLLGVVIVAAAGGHNTSVTGVTAQAALDGATPIVQMQWRDNAFGSGTVLEYHIWRVPGNGFARTADPVATAPAGSPRYTDYPVGAPQQPIGFWDGTKQFLQVPLSTTSGSTSSGTSASLVTPKAGAVPGFTVGQTYTYQISAVIRRQLITGTGGGGTGTGIGTGGGGGTGTGIGTGTGTGGGTGTTTSGTEDLETDPVSSGPVTPLNMPVLVSPTDGATNVPATAAVFTWLSRTGADTFQVEVSQDPTFTNPSLIIQTRVLSTSPFADGVAQTSPPINLSNLPAVKSFLNATAGSNPQPPQLYWRVGARHAADQPGPADWLQPMNIKAGDNNFRFIYSTIRGFKPALLPPPAP